MTRQEWKARLAIITAFANGEEIQYYYWGSWHTCKDLDFAHPSEGYRIKPKPRSYRPWKSEEVPVGALIKWAVIPEDGAKGFDIATIIAVSGSHIIAVSGSPIITGMPLCYYPFDFLLVRLIHSIDQGKTWLPCGVLE